MQRLSKLFRALVKFLSKALPKQHFEIVLRKEQCPAPFIERPALNLLSAKNRQKCNGQKFCFKYGQNLSVRLPQTSCFKAQYERSDAQLLS